MSFSQDQINAGSTIASQQAIHLRNARADKSANKSVSFAYNRVIQQCPPARIRPDLVLALLGVAGYSATDIAQFYIQAKICKNPGVLSAVLQLSGLTTQVYSGVLNRLGTQAAVMCGVNFNNLMPQNVFTDFLSNQINILPPDVLNFVGKAGAGAIYFAQKGAAVAYDFVKDSSGRYVPVALEIKKVVVPNPSFEPWDQPWLPWNW